MSYRSFWTSLLGFTLAAGCVGGANQEGQSSAGVASSDPSLDPTMIPQFVDPLPILPEFALNRQRDPVMNANVDDITVTISQFKEQMLPQKFPQTNVYGYGGNVVDA